MKTKIETKTLRGPVVFVVLAVAALFVAFVVDRASLKYERNILRDELKEQTAKSSHWQEKYRLEVEKSEELFDRHKNELDRLKDEISALEKDRDDAFAELEKSRNSLRLDSASRNWRVQWVTTGSNLKPRITTKPSYATRKECESADHQDTAWMLSAFAAVFGGNARFTASCVEVAP